VDRVGNCTGSIPVVASTKPLQTSQFWFEGLVINRKRVPNVSPIPAAFRAFRHTGATHDTRDDAPVFATVERKRGRDGVMRPKGRPLSPRMVTRVFRKYADKAEAAGDGAPARPASHGDRERIRQGEDMLVAAFAGHAKTSTTTDTYRHLMPKRAQDAARRMRCVSHVP
jgi:hypothetical protein